MKSLPTTKVTVLPPHGSASRTRNDCKCFNLSLARNIPILVACSVGDSAKNAFHSNPENTVFDAKRLIGRKFDDPEIQRDMKHWPFKIVPTSDGRPTVEVDNGGKRQTFVSGHNYTRFPTRAESLDSPPRSSLRLSLRR